MIRLISQYSFKENHKNIQIISNKKKKVKIPFERSEKDK